MRTLSGKYPSSIRRTFLTEKSPYALLPSQSESCSSGYFSEKGNSKLPRGIAGFTITEIIVVIGIIALLLSIGVGYTQKGGKQIVLFREHAHLNEQILRARSFATQKLRPGQETICGYGISIIDNAHYSLFKDLTQGGGCPGNGVMDADEELEAFILNKAVSIFEYNHTQFIFSPRDGFVYFGTERAQPNQDPAYISLQLEGTDQRLTLNVNYIGQVYTE